MSDDEKSLIMRYVETIPKGHTRFLTLSDGTDIVITKGC